MTIGVRVKGFGSSISGLYRDIGKENGNYYMVYWGFIGIMET